MTATTLRLIRSGPIATVVLDGPSHHNAINLNVYRQLAPLVRELDKDPEVHVIVFRGEGRAAFAAGADITEFQEVRADSASARIYNQHVSAAERAIAEVTKPTIALIHGHCVGGGLGLALACDLRFADERVRVAVTPAKLGIVYSLESTKRIVALVGPSRAKWILMSGEVIVGGRVRELGLVDEIYPTEELEHATYAFADTVCQRSQYSVRAAKAIVSRVTEGQVTDDDFTTDLRDGSFDTADFAEGVRAFLEKRPAQFHNTGEG